MNRSTSTLNLTGIRRLALRLLRGTIRASRALLVQVESIELRLRTAVSAPDPDDPKAMMTTREETIGGAAVDLARHHRPPEHWLADIRARIVENEAQESTGHILVPKERAVEDPLPETGSRSPNPSNADGEWAARQNREAVAQPDRFEGRGAPRPSSLFNAIASSIHKVAFDSLAPIRRSRHVASDQAPLDEAPQRQDRESMEAPAAHERIPDSSSPSPNVQAPWPTLPELSISKGPVESSLAQLKERQRVHAWNDRRDPTVFPTEDRRNPNDMASPDQRDPNGREAPEKLGRDRAQRHGAVQRSSTRDFDAHRWRSSKPTEPLDTVTSWEATAIPRPFDARLREATDAAQPFFDPTPGELWPALPKQLIGDWEEAEYAALERRHRRHLASEQRGIGQSWNAWHS